MADEMVQPEATVEPGQVATVHGGKPTMEVKVYAPFKVYYEGNAHSVSAVNDTGPFDILPKHHNLLCMLVPCSLVIKTPEGEKTIKVHRALMHVKANRAVIFMDV